MRSRVRSRMTWAFPRATSIACARVGPSRRAGRALRGCSGTRWWCRSRSRRPGRRRSHPCVSRPQQAALAGRVPSVLRCCRRTSASVVSARLDTVIPEGQESTRSSWSGRELISAITRLPGASLMSSRHATAPRAAQEGWKRLTAFPAPRPHLGRHRPGHPPGGDRALRGAEHLPRNAPRGAAPAATGGAGGGRGARPPDGAIE